MNKALEMDEKGDHKNALTLYIQAVEMCTTSVIYIKFKIALTVFV